MESSRQSPIDEYDLHGVKTVGDYEYWLLIDVDGNCVISQIKSDDSTFLFTKMPDASGGFSARASAIDEFWTNPENHTYKYLFLL